MDDWQHVSGHWDEPSARDEASRLNRANDEPSARYDVVQVESRGVYPADESPPWEPDPDRFKSRGYEATE